MDFDPLIRRLAIRDKDVRIAGFVPNWAQQEFISTVNDQYNAGRPVRVIVLKARQLGISTVTEALMFWWSFLYEHSHGLVMAHENEASEHLLSITKLYWETFPFKQLFTPKYVSRKELSWIETGSTLRIATAGGKGAARGRTINALHASEIAFWDHPDEIMLGLRQTIPQRHGSMIVLESTANGIGNWFYDAWEASVAGDSEYAPLFFPWWRHPEYTATHIGLKMERLTRLTEEERVLKKMGVDDNHLIWRRWAQRNLANGDELLFMQEYPATPEEAFIASGTNVFPIEKLKKCYDPKVGVRGFLQRNGDSVEFVPDIAGPLTVYKTPSRDLAYGQYFVGGDPTHTTRGDFACAQVINSVSYEQVATWHGRIDPMSFAEELAKLGAYYNQAMIATEVEGPGYATIGRLVEMDYPNLWRNTWADRIPGKLSETMGWSTTHKRKEWAVGWLIKLLVDEDVTLHHQRTFEEMRTYVTLDNGGYGPANASDHDDCVMAFAIACICNSTQGPRNAYKAAIESRAPGNANPPTDPAWALIQAGEPDW